MSLSARGQSQEESGWPPGPLLQPPLCCVPQGTELLLEEGAVKVAESAPARDLTYRVRHMGLFLVIETRHGVVVAWDRKTSVFIWLSQDYKVSVGRCLPPEPAAEVWASLRGATHQSHGDGQALCPHLRQVRALPGSRTHFILCSLQVHKALPKAQDAMLCPSSS